jgi:predicted nucleotide-binding protein (sugar kinase/HSP70/actin superfamily)
MADHAEVFAAAFRHCGIDAEVLPKTDNRSLELGRKLTGGRECYPAVLTAGDLARELEKPHVDPNKVAFFMPTAGGPCRFGQYHHLHKQLMDNLGYDNIPVYSPTSDDSYGAFPGTTDKFRRLAWRSFLAADYMRKFLLKSRPYESKEGEADKVFRKYLDESVKAIEQGGDNLPMILKDAFYDFKNITNKNINQKPSVGVVGEIYIRNNEFSNNDLIRKLESLGIEVDIASFSEWIFFTTEMYKRDALRQHSKREYLDSKLKNFFQRKDEKIILSQIHNSLEGETDNPVEDILNLVDPYLPISVGGEAMPALGKAIDMFKLGRSGIVNTLPFTCMPGNIVNAISSEVTKDLGGFPWLNIAYDGTNGDGDMVKLGAFVESVKAWDAKKQAENLA